MTVFTFRNNTKMIMTPGKHDSCLSYISVFALPNNIVNIAIHLYGLAAENINSLSLLLVAPDQLSSLVLLNGIESTQGQQLPVDIIIIDEGKFMPVSSILTDGQYKPTSYDNYPEPEPEPEPEPSYNINQPFIMGKSTIKSTFIATKIPLDGEWSLYAVSAAGTAAISGGWEISFYTKFNKLS